MRKFLVEAIFHLRECAISQNASRVKGGAFFRSGGPAAFAVGGTSLSRYEPHRDQEVSPTGTPRASSPGGLSYGTLAGDRPPRYDKKRHPLPVGRGPVPRQASIYRIIAGDRPPRYGNGRVSWMKNAASPRRARACPSPGLGLSNNRGGQAPALQ